MWTNWRDNTVIFWSTSLSRQCIITVLSRHYHELTWSTKKSLYYHVNSVTCKKITVLSHQFLIKIIVTMLSIRRSPIQKITVLSRQFVIKITVIMLSIWSPVNEVTCRHENRRFSWWPVKYINMMKSICIPMYYVWLLCLTDYIPMWVSEWHPGSVK